MSRRAFGVALAATVPSVESVGAEELLLEGAASKSDIKFIELFTARDQSSWIAAATVTAQRKRSGRPKRVLQKLEYGVGRGRGAGMEAHV